jgi:K(+)-stimulated pyrophosphate-energized sodium pump
LAAAHWLLPTDCSPSAIGFAIGAFMSGIAGYIGMMISVRANVRTAEAARTSMQKALTIAFRSGAVTGMFVVGLGLLGTAGYYFYLQRRRRKSANP